MCIEDGLAGMVQHKPWISVQWIVLLRTAYSHYENIPNRERVIARSERTDIPRGKAHTAIKVNERTRFPALCTATPRPIVLQQIGKRVSNHSGARFEMPDEADCKAVNTAQSARWFGMTET
jgi:hypothetical protein